MRLNENQKRAIYSDIMNDVARMIKTRVNEGYTVPDKFVQSRIKDMLQYSKNKSFEDVITDHKFLGALKAICKHCIEDGSVDCLEMPTPNDK